MSISSYEQMPLNNSIDNPKSSYHHYAVTPLLRTVVQPQSSDPNLPLDERVNQLKGHRKDTTKILEFTDEAQNFGNNLVTQESDAQSDIRMKENRFAEHARLPTAFWGYLL
ncbi:unnamed protein product [Anisakis simplex]|uniref:Uncharacterized protein n=1 Tax=Anisakis simplex TaxID=6269 RepID=A0A0M3KJT3_ANISI|nr:unnamed protein product [Anisakis simplex]